MYMSMQVSMIGLINKIMYFDQYISNKSCLKKLGNESSVLKMMIIFGLSVQGIVAFVVSTVDERGVLTKLCKHASDSNLELIASFKSVS